MAQPEKPSTTTTVLWCLKVAFWLAALAVGCILVFMKPFSIGVNTEETGACEMNLAALASAAQAYSAKHEGKLPDKSWEQALAPYAQSSVIFSCPHQRRIDPSSSGYAMNRDVVGRVLATLPPDAISFFDYQGFEHGAIGGIHETPKPGRHRRGRANCVVFANGKPSTIEAK